MNIEAYSDVQTLSLSRWDFRSCPPLLFTKVKKSIKTE